MGPNWAFQYMVLNSWAISLVVRPVFYSLLFCIVTSGGNGIFISPAQTTLQSWTYDGYFLIELYVELTGAYFKIWS